MNSAFFSAGFRPMFLGAAIWAALSMGLWIGFWTGASDWSPRWGALDWHVHELLFGYGGAVLCGFLLTAIPNWTGRKPVAGAVLAGLWMVWLAGRVAIGLETPLSTLAVSMIDLSFLALVCGIATREIVAGGNRRNLPVAAICIAFLAANLLFHLDVLGARPASSGPGAKTGIAVLILLIGLIGGRIVPAFTGNWLRQQGQTAQPAQFGTADKAILIASGLILLAWLVRPASTMTGGALMVAALLHGWRLMRWQGHRTFKEPLILALHVGYSFVSLGFLLIGLSVLSPGISPVAGLHAWTSGAIGTMTMIVMTRATLGHSGQPLKAGRTETVFLSLIVSAGLARIAASLGLWPDLLLDTSAAFWIAGFSLFAIRFTRSMFTPKSA